MSECDNIEWDPESGPSPPLPNSLRHLQEERWHRRTERKPSVAPDSKEVSHRDRGAVWEPIPNHPRVADEVIAMIMYAEGRWWTRESASRALSPGDLARIVDIAKERATVVPIDVIFCQF